MSKDLSLTEFTGTETETDAEPDAAATDAGTTDADHGAGVRPAVPTYAWDPDGVACADCGERTARRWRRDDDWVCAACKPW